MQGAPIEADRDVRIRRPGGTRRIAARRRAAAAAESSKKLVLAGVQRCVLNLVFRGSFLWEVHEKSSSTVEE